MKGSEGSVGLKEGRKVWLCRKERMVLRVVQVCKKECRVVRVV